MGALDFLKDIKIEEITKTSKSTGIVKKQRGPEESQLAIRVWKDGSVYPSKALVEKFGLEYQNAIITEEVKEGDKKVRKFSYPDGPGNGLDIIDSRAWGQYKNEDPKAQFIAIAIVPKDLPKVDLFANTRYNEDGTPVSSVLDQGASTFGEKNLLPLIKEIYEKEPGEEGFIDLILEEAVNLKTISPNGLFHFPKMVVRGKDQGKSDYERRENVDIFGIAPALVPPAKGDEGEGAE